MARAVGRVKTASTLNTAAVAIYTHAFASEYEVLDLSGSLVAAKDDVLVQL